MEAVPFKFPLAAAQGYCQDTPKGTGRKGSRLTGQKGSGSKPSLSSLPPPPPPEEQPLVPPPAGRLPSQNTVDAWTDRGWLDEAKEELKTAKSAVLASSMASVCFGLVLGWGA